MKYLEEPGDVTEYSPALPEGARSDDDNDFEWVYVYAMQQENELLLSPTGSPSCGRAASKGYRWMLAQGWPIVDRYENQTRDQMPMDETITSYADRLVELAERTIVQGGGERALVRGRPVYRIRTEPARNVQPLPRLQEQLAALRSRCDAEVDRGVLHGSSRQEQARAAYLAIALDLAPQYRARDPQSWDQAVKDLAGYWNVVQALYYFSDTPRGKQLQAKAAAAGLARPAKARRPWN